MDLLQKLNRLESEAKESIEKIKSIEELRELTVRFLGRRSALTEIMKSMKTLPKDLRPQVGKKANEVKTRIEKLIEDKEKQIERNIFLNLKDTEWVDITEPGDKFEKGHLHPITIMRMEVEYIFTSMGFAIVSGPEVELDYYNFEALNIPQDHPARDMQDTIWTKDGSLLRTHTSCVQIRTMEKFRPPIRAIAPGRVFRYEETDASHEHTFYQVEGLMIDRGISVANLIAVMKTMLREVFGRDVKVRLRPGYFPFVEPGFELDINCLICGGKGCPVCKRSGWVELLPCGMVHPNVLRAGNIDPDEYSGFAFGMGLDRLVMMRYGIDDIRVFHSGDLRFLEQF